LLWRLGRILRRKTTLAALSGGVLAFFGLGLIWIGWSLPSIDGPRTGAEGLRLLVALSDIAALELSPSNGAEGARVHRQMLAALPADLPWDWQLFWMEALSLCFLVLGLLSFYALLPRLHGAGVLLALSALLLLPFTGLNLLMPQTGASIGAGLFLLSAMLAPRLRVLRLYLASALVLLVHPAAWGFAIVALLLILQRWVDGLIEGRRATAEIAGIAAGSLGLAAFLERASLSVDPIFPRPEIDLTALAEMMRGSANWGLSLQVWDMLPLALTLLGLLQTLRHGERVPGFRSVVVMVILVIPLVAAFTVAGRPGQAVFALLLTLPLLAIPALGVAESVPRGDARRGQLLALALGLGVFVFGQSAIEVRDNHWPDIAAASVTTALDEIGTDTPLAMSNPKLTEPAARLAGWSGTYNPNADVRLVPYPKAFQTTTGLSRSALQSIQPGFDLRDMGVLRITVPAGPESVWVRWNGVAELVAAIGPKPCQIVPLSEGWLALELAGCTEGEAALVIDLSGEGAVTGVSLDEVSEGSIWPWGRTGISYAYASGGGWRRAPLRLNGNFGWAALGLADGEEMRVLSDRAGLIVVQK
jgi:hypothetical protein